MLPPAAHYVYLYRKWCRLHRAKHPTRWEPYDHRRITKDIIYRNYYLNRDYWASSIGCVEAEIRKFTDVH